MKTCISLFCLLIILSSCKFYRPNHFETAHCFSSDTSLRLNSYVNDFLKINLKFYGNRSFKLFEQKPFQLSHDLKKELRQHLLEFHVGSSPEALFFGHDWMGYDFRKKAVSADSTLMEFSDLYCFFIPPSSKTNAQHWKRLGFGGVI